MVMATCPRTDCPECADVERLAQHVATDAAAEQADFDLNHPDPWTQPEGDTTMTTTPEPVAVSFDIDLSTVIGSHYRQTGEEDYSQEPETLGDRVATLVADRVFREHRDSFVGYERNAAVVAAVDRAIDARVAAALERTFTPTDGYGQPKGEPTTLGETIDQRLAGWFQATKGSSGYERRQVTNLDALIAAAVESGIRKDVDGAVKAAKDQIVAAMKDQAATIMAETLARTAGIR